MEELTKAIDKLVKSQNEFLVKLVSDIKVKQSETSGSHGGTSSTQNIPPFHAYIKDKGSWSTYVQQLQQHFIAYGVSCDDKKRAYFLSWIGAETYELLEKLFGSSKLTEQNLNSLIEKLSDHFKSKVHVCTARYNFFKCRMGKDQTYSEWIANLRGLARDCQFICSSANCKQEFIEEMIRDIVILHTPHDAVRTAALQKQTSTFAEVVLIAEAFESTQKSMQMLKNEAPETASDVNQIKTRNFKNVARSRNASQNRDKSNRILLKSCSGCNTHHTRSQCKFLNAVCRKCNKKGHIAPVCQYNGDNYYLKSGSYRSRNGKSPVKYEHINSVVEYILSVDDVIFRRENKLLMKVVVNNREMEFLLDTGASVSLIGLPGFNKLNCPQYSQSTRKLNAYGVNTVPILGETTVSVKFNGMVKNLPLLITNTEGGDNIFGMDWANIFGMRVDFDRSDNVKLVESIPTNSSADIEAVCSKYPELFSPSLGHCTSLKASLYLKPSARPKFFRARPIPYAQLELFKQEAQRLESANIWKPIRFGEWATPIVIVPKRNNSLRICGDFKVSVNPQLEVDQYPIPRPEELLHKLAKGQYFSKIDMSDAYLQIELEDESKKLAVVNTPLGLYQYQRLPFGIASAPAIFQRTLEMILTGLECAIYLDDILVTGQNHQEHLRNLEAVFQRLQEHGLRVNRNKCSFLQPKVEYLGNIIDSKGVRPSEAGLEAVKKLPRPTNLKELQAFMGKINYYNKFIRNLAQTAAPLNALRKKNVTFHWNSAHEHAFRNLKQQVVEATRLAHFRPELPIRLATDASSNGIGAVIAHILPDGTEQPIAYASKTLNEHQINYSQVEKEAFAIIYGVTKFRQYLYGREFTLITDHKPLITLFHPDKRLPQMTTSRLLRWALILMGYQYKIQYRPTEKHANADALSRLPSGPDSSFDASEESCQEISLEMDEQVESFPVNAQEIAKVTQLDPNLRKVQEYISQGWPEKLPSTENHLLPYFHRRMSLILHKGIILLNTEYIRVVVPKALQTRILRMLHQGHWGVVRTKQLARRYCWWPQVDSCIESNAKSCNICQASAADPPKEYTNWPQPKEPWERIHIDFAGPFLHRMWLLCTDALSKFPFAIPMKETTSAATIQALTKIFALEGLPEIIVSDNGTQFSARDFQEFCRKNGIQHLRTAPFHPASNGEAERLVRTFKVSLQKIHEEEKNIDIALSQCLMTYRNTPNPQTGMTPAEILHGREHRTNLSQIVPSNNISQSPNHHKFKVGETVYARNYARGPRWIEGTIKAQKGSRLYSVLSQQGIWKRHQNQLRRRCSGTCESFTMSRNLVESTSSYSKEGNHENDAASPKVQVDANSRTSSVTPKHSPRYDQSNLRRSTRERKPVVRFQIG